MALALPTPRNHSLAALACMSLLAACPKPDDPEQDEGTGVASDTDTTGTSAPGATTSGPPTTGTAPGDTAAPTTGAEPTTTSGQGPSDSTTDATTATSEPDFGNCPYEPGGLDVALARVEQDITTDLGEQPCGAAQQFPALAVVAASDDHLEASVCADATCGACDPGDRIDLALTLPDGLDGLPTHLAVGDCVQLDVAWDRPGEGPQACSPSALALVRLRRGQVEPVPTFMYRYTETLPHTDVLGPFSLTGVFHEPGAIACPCDGDCCDDPPGSRRLRFLAKLWNAEIEGPAVDPGATVPLFAFGTPEGDDLYGDLTLVRAYTPGECGAPSRHEWLLRVTPG